MGHTLLLQRPRVSVGDDPAAMRHALETLRRMSAPYLAWTGKAERTSFEVDTVSLHVHERIDAMSILSAVGKRQKENKPSTAGFQPGLFEAPFESMPLRSAVDFYKHDRGWANRLVAGDSLLVLDISAEVANCEAHSLSAAPTSAPHPPCAGAPLQSCARGTCLVGAADKRSAFTLPSAPLSFPPSLHFQTRTTACSA